MLETRVFGEEDLFQHLRDGGFEDSKAYPTRDFLHGMWWPEPLVPSNLRQKADESLLKKLERIVRLIRPALTVRAFPTGRVRLPTLSSVV